MQPDSAAEDPTLRSLRRDFRLFGLRMQQLAIAAVENEATRYPIFIAHLQREPAPALGLPVAEVASESAAFAMRIAPIEELVRKGLIEADAQSRFIDAAGDAFERACVLLIEAGAGRFVFIPYEVEL